MNNFTQTYLIIGIALYLMTATFICVIGKDYIDEAIKKGEIENIDVNIQYNLIQYGNNVVILPLRKYINLSSFEITEIENVNDKKVGDIVVFQPIGKRYFGHIAMWNGRQWISDFKQRNIIVHSDYRKEGCEYAIFRKGE